MCSDNNIYLVFLSTPYMTGRIIRFFTKHLYNHVAISFDKDLDVLYSFARFYKSNPLYAGFVRESKLRYKSETYKTKIKVCKIEITDKEKEDILKYISEVENSEERYLYNLYSCFGYLRGKKINIKNSFTCIEFIISIIIKCCNKKSLEKDKFYHIEDLEEIYKDDIIYEGTYQISDDYNNWGEDDFLRKYSFFKRANHLAKSYYIVTKRLLSKS